MVGSWRFALSHGHIDNTDQFITEDPNLTNAAVTASSSETRNPAANAFDGDTATRWCASDDTFPQWLGADLGQVQHVTDITLTWENATDQYLFRIEGSLDKKSWTALANKTDAPGAGDGPVTLTPGDFRYVRVYITGNNSTHWASLRDVQIHYNDSTGKDVVWSAPTGQPTAPPAAIVDAFASPGFDDSSWHNITVPSNWEVLGYSLPTYNSVDNTVGEYRRTVTVPASWAGKKIYWRFDGALDGAEVFVNGQKAGYHESGYTAWDIDLTGIVLPGKPNLFAVRVSKTVPSYDCETGDFQCMGGIYRETSLIAVPPTHVSDITVRTPLSTDYKEATLNADITVQADPGATVQVAGALVKVNGNATGNTVSGAAIADSNGSATVTLSSPVAAPALWSAEKPNLYYLVLQLTQGGKPIERVEQRFGFKQIDVKNSVVLWNGVPIKCQGTCRHDFWADKGFALSDTEWNKDLTLMKAANINAIRTSHYNHAERFLELCEERGMYILDEVPFCWIGNKINDPAYAPYLLQRAQETLERDKNRPCVLAWSIGNENGYGQNEQPVFDLVKQIDPTRPAFVSQQSPNQIHGEQWQDKHYPGPAEVDRDVQNAAMIFNYSESPHIFWQKETQDYDPGASDLWSEALSSLWSKIWTAPNILGSFIWEWQNQGIADQNANKTTDFYYGPDRLRDENDKGVVDSYRNPKAEWWIVKQVYSQVVVGAKTVAPSSGQATVPLTNHYSFTDLRELTCKWTAYNGTNVLQTGTQHIACPPMQSVQATFPAPAGITELRLEFDHADGTSVVAANLAVDGATQPAAPSALPAGADLTVADAPNTLTVSNDISSLIFDKQSGAIQAWTVKGKTILVRGPTLNLGQGKAGNTRGFFRFTGGPMLQNAVVTAAAPAVDGSVTVTVAGSVANGPNGAALGNFTGTYAVHTDAEINVTWSLNWTAANTNLWEEGLELLLPGTINKMNWQRDSYFTDYPDGHVGAPSGTAGSADITFHASKRNLQWLTLTDASNTGIALLPISGSSLVGRADGRVPPKPTLGPSLPLFVQLFNHTTLYASTDVAGPRDFSGNWVSNHDIHATAAQPLGGAFTLRALAP